MTKKDLKNKLLAQQIKPRPFVFGGDTYFVRTTTVGDINYEINQRERVLETLAAQKGLVIDETTTPEDKKEIFAKILGEFTTAMNVARYLSDASGDLIFNVRSIEDLQAINMLHPLFLSMMEKATEEQVSPKP